MTLFSGKVRIFGNSVGFPKFVEELLFVFLSVIGSFTKNFTNSLFSRNVLTGYFCSRGTGSSRGTVNVWFDWTPFKRIYVNISNQIIFPESLDPRLNAQRAERDKRPWHENVFVGQGPLIQDFRLEENIRHFFKIATKYFLFHYW